MMLGNSSMRGLTGSLLCAGVLFALLTVQCAAAAPHHSHRKRARQLPQQAAAAATAAAHAQRGDGHVSVAAQAAIGPLLPSCIPKYVTQLVIPSPMPITHTPLANQVGAWRPGSQPARRPSADPAPQPDGREGPADNTINWGQHYSQFEYRRHGAGGAGGEDREAPGRREHPRDGGDALPRGPGSRRDDLQRGARDDDEQEHQQRGEHEGRFERHHGGADRNDRSNDGPGWRDDGMPPHSSEQPWGRRHPDGPGGPPRHHPLPDDDGAAPHPHHAGAAREQEQEQPAEPERMWRQEPGPHQDGGQHDDAMGWDSGRGAEWEDAPKGPAGPQHHHVGALPLLEAVSEQPAAQRTTDWHHPQLQQQQQVRQQQQLARSPPRTRPQQRQQPMQLVMRPEQQAPNPPHQQQQQPVPPQGHTHTMLSLHQRPASQQPEQQEQPAFPQGHTHNIINLHAWPQQQQQPPTRIQLGPAVPPVLAQHAREQQQQQQQQQLLPLTGHLASHQHLLGQQPQPAARPMSSSVDAMHPVGSMGVGATIHQVAFGPGRSPFRQVPPQVVAGTARASVLPVTGGVVGVAAAGPGAAQLDTKALRAVYMDGPPVRPFAGDKDEAEDDEEGGEEASPRRAEEAGRRNEAGVAAAAADAPAPATPAPAPSAQPNNKAPAPATAIAAPKPGGAAQPSTPAAAAVDHQPVAANTNTTTTGAPLAAQPNVAPTQPKPAAPQDKTAAGATPPPTAQPKPAGGAAGGRSTHHKQGTPSLDAEYYNSIWPEDSFSFGDEAQQAAAVASYQGGYGGHGEDDNGEEQHDDASAQPPPPQHSRDGAGGDDEAEEAEAPQHGKGEGSYGGGGEQREGEPGTPHHHGHDGGQGEGKHWDGGSHPPAAGGQDGSQPPVPRSDEPGGQEGDEPPRGGGDGGGPHRPPPHPTPAPVPDTYHISVRQISQDVLPPHPNALPQCPSTFDRTHVFAYGPADLPGAPSRHAWPGATLEAQRNKPAHIKWTNDLVDNSGHFLPHILAGAIDQTLHWANPEAIGGGTDSSPCHACQMSGQPEGACANDPSCVRAAKAPRYLGPVPTVAHVHGAENVPDYSDGYTEAWFLPNAKNLTGYTPVGAWYNTFQSQAEQKSGVLWGPGSSTSVYPNTQRPTPLWYHDHTLGLTRINLYSGMAGFYFVRETFPSLANGPELPGLPYPANDGLVDPTMIRELPLAIQDRAFTNDSQLWYPVVDLAPEEALPYGPLPPKWIPEFSATVSVGGQPTNMLVFTVNGRTYPYQVAFPDAYRLRILNACNARTMQLKFARSASRHINPLNPRLVLLPFWVVGNEAGFYPQLQAPVTAAQIGPADRLDIVIDFTGVHPGEYVFMLNNGPETETTIYDGTNNGEGLTEHTAQVMRFDVKPLPASQTARPFNLAAQSALNAALQAQYVRDVRPLPRTSTSPVRRVAVMEKQAPDGTPITSLLGTATATSATPTYWSDEVTTDISLDKWQQWDIINLSEDAHPIHVHVFGVRFLGRFLQNITVADPVNKVWQFTDTDIPVPNADLDPLMVMPCAADPSGQCAVPKDMVTILPGTRTRIAFYGPPTGLDGLYVWHCHLVEHEDNEMMNQMCQGSPTYKDPKTGLPMCPGPN